MALYPIFRYLDTVGDGTGTKNANGDYSVTPGHFKIVVPAGHGYTIASMLIHISGNANFNIFGYGNIAAGLTNGVTIQFSIGGVVQEITDGLPFKTNDDWSHVSPSINHLSYAGGGDSLVVPFLIQDFGIPLTLGGGDYLQVTLNDNFTALSSHHFVVHGYRN